MLKILWQIMNVVITQLLGPWVTLEVFVYSSYLVQREGKFIEKW